MLKRKIKKIIAIALTATMMISASSMPAEVNAAEVDSSSAVKDINSDFLFRLSNDGTASVASYTGNESDVVIPSEFNGYKVTNIDAMAFEGCMVESVTIPDGVISIQFAAFRGCTGLTSIIIPDSVIKIFDSAFRNCNALSNIFISDEVQYIDKTAFINTKYYNDNYNWKNGVLYINNHLIDTKLDISGEYSIKPTTKTIAKSAFMNCTDINKIIIPESVRVINDEAFKNCSNLKEILISDNLDIIGSNVFYNTSYYNDENNWQGNALYIGKNLIKVNSNAQATFTIKNDVSCIANAAFEQCEKITKVNIPQGVTCISRDLFRKCTNLKSVVIPDSVERIGHNAFTHCSSLIDITIPDSVTTMGDWVFIGCTSLRSAKLSRKVTCIPNRTFEDCKKLSEIVIPEGVTIIGYQAFYGCESLQEIIIPDSVVSIEKEAFNYCSNIESVVLEDGLKYINSDAFYYCSNLKFIFIPRSVIDISMTAFSRLNGVSISGYVGSAAEKYAKRNNFEFVPIYDVADVDLDGRVTIQDATLMQRYCAEDVTLNQIQLSLADADGNGDISIGDATAIQKIVAAN